MENTNNMHSVLIENRRRIRINCVEDVESFNEEKVIVYTTAGEMVVSGYDFKVSRLSVEDGELIIEGEIDRVEYAEYTETRSGGGLFGKLFK